MARELFLTGTFSGQVNLLSKRKKPAKVDNNSTQNPQPHTPYRGEVPFKEPEDNALDDLDKIAKRKIYNLLRWLVGPRWAKGILITGIILAILYGFFHEFSDAIIETSRESLTVWSEHLPVTKGKSELFYNWTRPI